MLSMIEAMLPPVAVKLAKFRGSVVSRSNDQRGWRAPSRKVPKLNRGGIDIPLCTSRSRAPAIGTSTVTINVS